MNNLKMYFKKMGCQVGGALDGIPGHSRVPDITEWKRGHVDRC